MLVVSLLNYTEMIIEEKDPFCMPWNLFIISSTSLVCHQASWGTYRYLDKFVEKFNLFQRVCNTLGERLCNRLIM